MKRIISLVLILSLSLSLCACGKSQAAKDAEAAIAAIGEVTKDSGDAIAKAEKLCSILTDSEKEDVSNRLVLADAKEAYEKLQSSDVSSKAQAAYDCILETQQLCSKGLTWFYNAIEYYIFLEDYNNFDTNFAEKLQDTSPEEVKSARNALGIHAADACVYGIHIAQKMVEDRGEFQKVQENMKKAEQILQELADDDTYYPALKDYYTSMKPYVNYYLSPADVFENLTLPQIKERRQACEDEIDAAGTEASILFH